MRKDRRYLVSFVVVSSVILLVLVEFFAGVYFKIAHPRLHVTDEDLREIYGESYLDYKLVLKEQAAPWKYVPFVEYAERERSGRYVNVNKYSVRCHYTEVSRCMPLGGNEIWFFGGSTTFGYGVKDNETVVSYLAQVYPTLNVLNFGTASHFSTPELIRFLQMLTVLPPPKAVIFLDGLNDFYYHDIPDRGALSAALEMFLESGSEATSERLIGWFRRSVNKLKIIRLLKGGYYESDREKNSLTNDQLAKVSNRLFQNFLIREAVAERYSVKSLNVLQPVPLYGQGHKSSKVPKKLLQFDSHVNSGAGYEWIFKYRLSSLKQPGILNLSELESPGAAYIDTVHYSPEFNKLIADRIRDHLGPL